MPLFAQHLVVIALAVACAAVLLVRRLRALRSELSACSACAYAALCEKESPAPSLGCEEEAAPKRRLPVLRGGALG